MIVSPQAPLVVVFNPHSGQHGGKHDAGDTRAAIEAVLQAAGRRYDWRNVDKVRTLQETARQAVVDARSRGAIVVVAGGDGTINTVAQAALGSGCALGVLPQGTFNYFCRTHGIADDAADATRMLLAAQPQPVQVGVVNGKVFLVNASLGLYPRLLEDREAYKRDYGRSRTVALWAAVMTLASAHRPLRLRLQHDGQQRALRTPTLFVGNNPLQLQQVGVAGVAALEQGALVAVAVKPVGTAKLLWLMARGAFGQLGAADDVVSFGFQQLTVQPAAPLGTRKVKVATDGEVQWLRAPLQFSVSPEPLWLLKPAQPAADE